jgi:hypothetical protein
MKDTITATAPVDSGVAEYHHSASDVERRKIELLVNLHLRDMTALARRRQEAEAARGECWEAELERRRADLIANLGLDKVPVRSRSLEEIMDELGRQAEKSGLTPEILQSILDECHPDSDPGQYLIPTFSSVRPYSPLPCRGGR